MKAWQSCSVMPVHMTHLYIRCSSVWSSSPAAHLQEPALEAALAAFAGLSLKTPQPASFTPGDSHCPTPTSGSGPSARPVTRSQTKGRGVLSPRSQTRIKSMLSPRGLPSGTPKAMPKSPHGKAAGSAKKGRFMAFLTGVKKPVARCCPQMSTEQVLQDSCVSSLRQSACM